MNKLPDGVTLHRILTTDDASRWRAGFIGAYQTVFSGFPYFERFYPSEAEGVYRKLINTPENITFVAVYKDQVIGFGSAIPLRLKADVSQELTGLVPIAHSFYLAELGVLENWRGKSIGHHLIQERLLAIDSVRYTQVVLRVSMNNNPSVRLYRSMGFDEMGVYMDVSSMRIEGRVTTDRRQFMSRMLSAPGQEGRTQR